MGRLGGDHVVQIAQASLWHVVRRSCVTSQRDATAEHWHARPVQRQPYATIGYDAHSRAVGRRNTLVNVRYK